MPGKNSGHDPSKDSLPMHWIRTKMWIWINLTVYTWGLISTIRYYYWRGNRLMSTDHLVAVVYQLISCFLILHGMIVTKNSDPGYVITAQKPAVDYSITTVDDGIVEK